MTIGKLDGTVRAPKIRIHYDNSVVLVGYLGIFFGRGRPGLARALATPLMLANAGFLAFLALNAVN